MQRRLFIVLGIVLAILVIIAVAFVAFNQQGLGIVPPAPTQPEIPAGDDEEEPTVSVIVARQPIARGGEFPAGSLGRMEWPVARLPEGAITNEAQTIGKIAKIEIVQGQIILDSYLQERALRDLEGEAAFQVPNGRVMVAFPIDRQTSVAYAIQAGDFVDVLITASFVDIDPEFQTILPNKFSFFQTSITTSEEGNEAISVSIGPASDKGRLAIENEQFPGFEFPSEDQRPRRVAQLTVQAAKVIRVGPWIEEPQQQPQPQEEGAPPPPPPLPNIVSLAVTPQDALVLLWARQTQARMELALRAAGDENALHSTEAVTLQYMLTRFSIAVPPKLEFGIDKSDAPIEASPAPAADAR